MVSTFGAKQNRTEISLRSLAFAPSSPSPAAAARGERTLPGSGPKILTGDLTPARDGSCLLVDFAFFRHQLDILEHLAILQRIAAHRDN